MKTILILLAAASMAFGQTLPYETRTTSANGWPQRVVYRQSPDDPELVLASVYSWVKAQVPYWKLKHVVECDRRKTLAYIASLQRTEAIAQEQRDYMAARDQQRKAEAAQRNADARAIERIRDGVREEMDAALRLERHRDEWYR